MDSIFESWNDIQLIFGNMPNIGVNDIVDIAIVAFLIYKLIIIIKNTRAWTLFKGIMTIAIIAVLAYFLNLNTVLWIISNTISVGIISIIIIFQPELRTALEKLGTGNMFVKMFKSDESKNEYISIKTVDEIVTGVKHLADKKTGAIIVIQQDVKLGEYETTGIRLSACVTSELLVNIFEKNTPLHDGAVMIRDNKITYATCYLPLSSNPGINKKYGTRHRAAIGISEISDAIVVTVSEETGSISIIINGAIKYNVLREQLRNEIIGNIKSDKKSRAFKKSNVVKGISK